MGKPDAPQPADPLGPLYLGQAFNSPNQYTPFGNLINRPPTLPYGTTADNFGSVPLNSIQPGSTTIQLPQNIQNIFDTQSGITQESLNQAWQNLQTLGQTQFDTQAINPADFQFGGIDQEVTQAVMDQQSALLNPYFDQREQQLRESLASRGIPVERGYGVGQTTLSHAAGTELGLGEQERNRAMQQAALQSVLAGRDEAYRQNMGNIGLQQTALQQNLGNQAFLQNQIAGPLGFQQIAPPQLSNFFAPSQQDVVGAFGQYDQANQSAFGSQMDLLASLYGAAGQLGGAAILASSKAMKHDRGDGEESVLDKLTKVPIRKWQYKGDPMVHIGPYAEDFHDTFGVGHPKVIWIPDLIGVVLAALKELNRKVDHAIAT